MSDVIKHECGIALLRLRKPLSYYIERYGTPTYGINKLYLLMEKQHNRGQDGAGVANIVMEQDYGYPYIFRHRSIERNPIIDIFEKIGAKFKKARKEKGYNDSRWLHRNMPFTGELFLGHLRYGTHGKNSIDTCHPVIRRSNWRSRNLALAGNFNMTNVEELFEKLIRIGQHPKSKTDTTTVLEKIGHFLDMENQRLFNLYEAEGLDDFSIQQKIEQELNLLTVLQRSCKDFDGGYSIIGAAGHGAAFVVRDPAGIRPAYYYANDEVIVVASEKPAIKTAFNAPYEHIKELTPAHALIINKDGSFSEEPFIKKLEKKSCSFERIYFSRGSDPAIYEERKNLGKYITQQVLEAIDYDMENTVFSYIPNTAETAFLGMMQALEDYVISLRKQKIQQGVQGEELEKILRLRPRVEKLVIKDVKLRTFITDDEHRDEMVNHVYDTTYEIVRKRQDTIVVIDDSIVRGTTLERSIITMLERLEPKRIIIVSSAPQIRYPDCYGIDMSRMKDFVAFRAMLELLTQSKQRYMLTEVYEKCRKSLSQSPEKNQNYVKELYDLFTYEQISEQVSKIVKPDHVQAEVKVIYQTVDNLHKACPEHLGDWYFTGNYPTQGGVRVVNKAYMNFMEGSNERAY